MVNHDLLLPLRNSKTMGGLLKPIRDGTMWEEGGEVERDCISERMQRD